MLFRCGLHADSIRPVDPKMKESSSIALADVRRMTVVVVFGLEYDLVCAKKQSTWPSHALVKNPFF